MISNKELIFNFLSIIKKEIFDRSISAGQKATGDTLQGINVEANDSSGILYGPTHVMVLENGRGPTKTGSKGEKTLIEIIENWIDSKGITPDGITKKSLAFLIARKIHNEGTLLFRRGGKSGVISLSITEERVSAFVESFANKYTSQYKSDILNEFNK